MPVAYTVEPNHDLDGFQVVGGNPVVIAARFSQVQEDDAAPAGEPIGAATLRSVFTEAVADVERKSRDPMHDETRRRLLKQLGRESEPDRPTVRSVVPLGACVPADSGRYSCHLRVQYIDLAVGAFTRVDPYVLEGEFDFEQQAGQWRAAPGFEQKFIEAKTRARAGAMDAEDPASSPE